MPRCQALSADGLCHVSWCDVVSSLLFVRHPAFLPSFLARLVTLFCQMRREMASKRSHFWQISGILATDQGKRHSLLCDSREDGQRRTLPHERKEIIMAGVSHSAEISLVLVHGGFVDGSGWEGVYRILKKDGYSVTIVQNPTISLADDVAVTKRIVHAQNGPVLLVGHSYGGAVITEAGNDPQVAGLVYIAAFAPDKGESVSTLIKDPPPGAPVPPILPPQDGYLFLDKAQFPASFAGDVDPEKALFMADSQVPWGLEALNGKINEPAWKSKPSWYLITTDDKMIPPDAQRSMSKRAGSTVVEVKGSHAVYVSQPKAVAALIEQAAESLKAAAA